MTAAAQPNRYGVWPAAECIELPNPRKGWRGLPLASIKIAQTPRGWMAAGGIAHASGGMCWPLSEQHCEIHETRAAAITYAASRIRQSEHAAAEIVRWIDAEVMPVQPDLWGAP